MRRDYDKVFQIEEIIKRGTDCNRVMLQQDELGEAKSVPAWWAYPRLPSWEGWGVGSIRHGLKIRASG